MNLHQEHSKNILIDYLKKIFFVLFQHTDALWNSKYAVNQINILIFKYVYEIHFNFYTIL